MNSILPYKEDLRILVTRTDRIGDLVLSTPVIQSLREKFPKAQLDFITLIENKEILEENPYLNELILYDKKGREKGWFGNFLFARKLNKRKYDITIHLHATNRMHIVTWLAGIPIRIGFNRKVPWTLTHPEDDLKSEGLCHEAEYNYSLLKRFGITSPRPVVATFQTGEKTERSLSKLLKHYKLCKSKPWVVLSPSASCPSKKWPAKRFGKLAKLIQEKYEVQILIIGTMQDQPLAQDILEAVDGSAQDLCGRLSLGMLAALLKRSALLVSNDSGPVHIANAVKTPAISIFGRNQPGLSPKRWQPLDGSSKVVWKDVGCFECLAHNCHINFLCLDVISPLDIMKEIRNFDDVLSCEGNPCVDA